MSTCMHHTHTRAHHTLTHTHTWYTHYNILTPHTHTYTHAFTHIYYTMHTHAYTHTYLQISSEKITTGPAICSEPRCSACLQLSVQFSEPSSSFHFGAVLTQSARSSVLRSPPIGLQITLLPTLRCRCCWRYHTWYPIAHSSLSSCRAPTSPNKPTSPIPRESQKSAINQTGSHNHPWTNCYDQGLSTAAMRDD